MSFGGPPIHKHKRGPQVLTGSEQCRGKDFHFSDAAPLVEAGRVEPAAVPAPTDSVVVTQ